MFPHIFIDEDIYPSYNSFILHTPPYIVHLSCYKYTALILPNLENEVYDFIW